MPELSTSRIIPVSGGNTEALVSRILALDAAAAIASTVDITINYVFVGQTTLFNSLILDAAKDGTLNNIITRHLFQVTDLVSHTKVLNKDRQCELVRSSTDVEFLENGDAAYVTKMAVLFSADTVQQLASICRVRAEDDSGWLGASTNTQYNSATQLTTECVEDIVRRMLADIPAVSAGTKTVFGVDTSNKESQTPHLPLNDPETVTLSEDDDGEEPEEDPAR